MASDFYIVAFADLAKSARSLEEGEGRVVLCDAGVPPPKNKAGLGVRWGKRIESVRPLVSKDQKGEGRTKQPKLRYELGFVTEASALSPISRFFFLSGQHKREQREDERGRERASMSAF